VVVEKGWSYVVGPGGSKNIEGPFRYQWEAQECADERNAALGMNQQTAPGS
jgi:hypothetical protein